MLFGSLSSGLSHKTKFVAWQCVAQAVNEVGGAAKVPKRRKKKKMKLQSKKPACDLEFLYIYSLLMLLKCAINVLTQTYLVYFIQI